MKPNIRLKILIKSVLAWQGDCSERRISTLMICMCSRFIRNAAYWSAAKKGSRRHCGINPFPISSGTCDFNACWPKGSNLEGLVCNKVVGYGTGTGRGTMTMAVQDARETVSGWLFDGDAVCYEGFVVVLQTMVGVY